MARWRWVTAPRIEPPEWYRNFHAEEWDEFDAQEQSMFDGCPSARPWPAELHEVHAHRRWQQAKYEYGKTHPALAEQEFNDIINEHDYRRRQEERRNW